MKSTLALLKKLLILSFIPLVITVVVFQVSFFLWVAEYYTDTTCYVIVAVALFTFYSLCKQTFKFDESIRVPYLEKGLQSFSEKAKTVLKRYDFWVISCFTALLFFAVPLKSFTVVLAGNKTDILSKLKILAFCLPVFTLLNFLAALAAMKDWDKGSTGKKGYSKAAFAEEIAVITGVYTIGGVVLVLLFPYVSGITDIFKGTEGVFSSNTVTAIAVILLAIIIIPPAVRTVRALLKRRAFIKQLKKVCEQKEYILSDIKVPYGSLFQPYSGESFTVKTDKKTYSCKLICGIKKNVPVTLYENGTGEYIHTFNIGAKGAKVELFRYVKKFNFGYESQHDKVVISVPVPRFMQMNKAGKIFPVDNGEEIGDYRLFAGTGFINALERECVDGARNKNMYKYI